MYHQPRFLTDDRSRRSGGLRRANLSKLGDGAERAGSAAWLYAALFAPGRAQGPRLLKVGVRRGPFRARFAGKQYSGWSIVEIGAAKGTYEEILRGEDALLDLLRPFAVDLGKQVAGGTEFSVYCARTLSIAEAFFPGSWRPVK